jgi:AcrR family transcriptional regulator
MVTQKERTDATRRALLDAGRALFAERGYANVSVADLATAAGVTTGAIYHQFASKEGVFRAVYDELVQGTWERILASRAAAPDRGLFGDCEVFLDACADPAFFQITVDGPTVIGWDQLIDATRRLIEASLHAAHDRGEIIDTPVEPLARMLAAALKEAGVMIATASDPATARIQARDAAHSLLNGIVKPR